MSAQPQKCEYCPRMLVPLNCAYPFWYHEGDTTVRHGEWVPEHDCWADHKNPITGVAPGCVGDA